jgi:hypothetical protein
MLQNLHISQRFNGFRKLLGPVAAVIVIAAPVWAQGQRPSLPDPVRFANKFDIVWNVARAVLDEMGYSIELEDRKGGRIATRPYEFITGSLTSSEVDKVAIKKDSITGDWIRARYSVDVLLEIISTNATLVTIRTKMEAMNREIDGTEKWLAIDSLGAVEKKILGKISMKLLGNAIDYDAKKGFWEKSPQPVDSRRPKPFPNRPPQ